MNIVFVNYDDFTSNSAVHIFNLANELVDRGAGCAVVVPGDPATVGLIGEPRFQALDFRDARRGALRFPDGAPPTLVHAWTPREAVRELEQFFFYFVQFSCSDIEPRGIRHREQPHAGIRTRSSRCPPHAATPLEQQPLGLARALCKHAVANKAFADADNDGPTCRASRQAPPRSPARRAPSPPAHHFQKPHDVRGAEEVQPDHVAGRLVDSRDRIDIEIGGVGSQAWSPAL